MKGKKHIYTKNSSMGSKEQDHSPVVYLSLLKSLLPPIVAAEPRWGTRAVIATIAYQRI